jgi:hypothetical protein
VQTRLRRCEFVKCFVYNTPQPGRDPVVAGIATPAGPLLRRYFDPIRDLLGRVNDTDQKIAAIEGRRKTLEEVQRRRRGSTSCCRRRRTRRESGGVALRRSSFFVL